MSLRLGSALVGHSLRGSLSRLSLGQDFECRGGSLSSPLTETFAPCVGGRFALGGRRWGFPRGYKGHKPRYYWNPEELAEKTAEYTHKPLWVRRQGGRDPETGKRVNQRSGGGFKYEFIMVDKHRRGPKDEGAFYAERVLEVRRHPSETAFIALVAGEAGKRWILATEGLEAGQIIRTTQHLPAIPIVGKDGDAHPVGALADGTLVSCVEKFPGEGGRFSVQAGGYSTVVRRQGGLVVLQSSQKKREFGLKPECMAVVGQLSHKEWAEKEWGSANMHRRFGYKQSSGLWHRKDRYSGRRYWPLPPMTPLTEPSQPPLEKYRLTLSPRDHDARFGNHQTNPFNLEGLELNGKYEY